MLASTNELYFPLFSSLKELPKMDTISPFNIWKNYLVKSCWPRVCILGKNFSSSITLLVLVSIQGV